MILVLETNGNLLYLFSSVAQAESHLEAIDIENREYEFCDETGQRFVGAIIVPVSRFSNGGFRLRPEGAPDKSIFDSLVAKARSLDRKCDGIKTLDDLKKISRR